MKKLFISIMALAAFVACQSNFENEISGNTPGFNGGADADLVTLYAEVGIGEETKATYGDDLSAKWEENDQIALLQESAAYNSTFNKVNALDIKRGAGTNSAAFWGDVTIPTESPRIFHIAYPVSAVSFVTTSECSLVGSVSYENNSPILGYQLKAHGTYNYTYNSTLNVTIPTSQSGKWEPYMYASTPEPVYADGIRTTNLTTLTGAIAIRAYEADGTTPKQLSKISVTSSSVAIAGAFSGTAQSVGSLGEVVGDETAWHTAFEENSAKTKALASLESKVKTMSPASTTVTKAMSLAFAGTAKTVTVQNADIVADANGDYVYYINVAPFAGEQISIQAVAEDGTSIIRTIPSATLAASQRMRVKLTWEHAGLTNGSIETWYDSYAGNHSTTLAANKVYVNNIVVEGVEASAVSAIGALVYDLNGNLVASNISEKNTLSLSQVVVDVPTSGTYNVISYAKVTVNGQERDITGEAKKVNVTSIPTDASLIQSSYSKNGSAAPTNSIGGTALEYTPALSDSAIPASLISSCQFVYNSTTVSATYKTKKSVSLALGQYNCYVKIVLGNGYVCQSGTYTTHITGIPYTMNVSSNTDNWSISGTHKWSSGELRLGNSSTQGVTTATKTFHMPANTSVKMDIRGKVTTSTLYTNTFKASISGSSVFSAEAVGKTFSAPTVSFDEKSKVGTMTNGNPTIELRNSSDVANRASYIYALSLQYNL